MYLEHVLVLDFYEWTALYSRVVVPGICLPTADSDSQMTAVMSY